MTDSNHSSSLNPLSPFASASSAQVRAGPAHSRQDETRIKDPISHQPLPTPLYSLYHTHNENLVTVLLAVTLYSNRFFHPGYTLLFPNLADLKSSPRMLRQVLLLHEMKNCGVRLLEGDPESCGSAIVQRIFDMLPPFLLPESQLDSESNQIK